MVTDDVVDIFTCVGCKVAINVAMDVYIGEQNRSASLFARKAVYLLASAGICSLFQVDDITFVLDYLEVYPIRSTNDKLSRFDDGVLQLPVYSWA